VQLGDEMPAMEDIPHEVWVDTGGRATLEQVLAQPSRFAPVPAGAQMEVGPARTIWLHLRVAREESARFPWRISFLQPLLDEVTLYQALDDGVWQAQNAGDSIPNSAWPEPGRVSSFRLDVPHGTVRDVYVRLRQATPIDVPIRLEGEPEHVHRLQLDYLALGIVFGALLLLIMGCMAQAMAYREPDYVWYALYAGVLSLALASYTGVAGHLLWPHNAFWADAAPGCLALVAGAAASLFVRHLCGLSARFQRLHWVVLGQGLIVLFAGLVYPWVPREPMGVFLLLTGLPLSVATGLLCAGLTWRRGDPVGAWVVAAYSPVGIRSLFALASAQGLLHVNWFTQFGVAASMGVEVPLLLVALSIRLRERHGAQARAGALASQDALTGLLAEHLFRDRLRQVVTRARRDAEPAAVVMIDLVNHSTIRRACGAAVAEQSLLRAVIKMRRVMRDVDTISRIGDARFALIAEGLDSRRDVTGRAAQLIAQGLMPLKGLKPDVTLQFHITAVLLTERLHDPVELMDKLGELMADMSPRTRRPIRFLEPELTRPMDLGSGPDSLNPQDYNGLDSIDPHPSANARRFQPNT